MVAALVGHLMTLLFWLVNHEKMRKRAIDLFVCFDSRDFLTVVIFASMAVAIMASIEG